MSEELDKIRAMAQGVEPSNEAVAKILIDLSTRIFIDPLCATVLVIAADRLAKQEQVTDE